jgi:pSer/pThr/pTyr-binding forkhead associated (FHA) protein
MFSPEGERRDVPIQKDAVTLGRDSSCDIRIPVAAVSRTHCRVEVTGDGVFVEDLGSRNGTYRNEDKVEERQPLEPGDRLAVGPVVFTVQINGDPEPVEPPLLESPMIASAAPKKDEAKEDVPEAIPGGAGNDTEDSAAGISDLLADMDGSSEFDFDLSDLEDDDK